MEQQKIEEYITQEKHKKQRLENLIGYYEKGDRRKLVSAIYVDATDKSSGNRVQHIHIKYDDIGFIPLNELLKEETA